MLTLGFLDPWKSILLDLWIPIKLFTFPIVEFASFIVSWSASCCKYILRVFLGRSRQHGTQPRLQNTEVFSVFDILRSANVFTGTDSKQSVLTLNLTQSQNFAAPPYEFSPTIIGFFNFAILVGGLIGLVTAGPLSDWISMKLTKKNRGIREPEMRLLTMIPYVVIMIIGNFVVAYGYEKKFDWKVRNMLLEAS